MRNTVLLIAASSICLIQAQSASGQPRNGFYASIHGGVNFLEDTDLEVVILNNPPLEGKLFFDTGWAGGVAFGYQWENGFSLEGETTYRQADLKGQEFMGTPQDISGDVSSFAGMMNASFELETGGPLSPYLGVGIGAARITVDANSDTPDAFKESDTKFAFQGMVGINYELSPQLVLGLEARYFDAMSPTFHGDGIRPTIDYHSEDVFLTMTYRLH